MADRIANLLERLRHGEITRRGFMRQVAALGLSVGAAEALAACSSSPIATATPAPPPAALPTSTPDRSLREDWRFYTCPYCGQTFDVWDVLEAHIAAAHGEHLARSPTPPAATPTPAPSEVPVERAGWLCTACGATLRTLDELKEHAVAEHGRRMPAIRKVSAPTYARFIVGPIERFDQRNQVFSRACWDKAYMARVREAQAAPRPSGPEALEGAALQAGAIYVDATGGSLVKGYGGYDGHLRGAGGLYSWDDPVGFSRYPISDPTAMSGRIKEVARFYGASLVGICRLDPRWVYSRYYDRATQASGEQDLPYRNAIVMAVEMDWQWIRGSPGFEASAATALGYSRMAEVAASLARYIRALGYPAVPAGNDSAQSIPLAVDAGLGELGRNGLLITPQFGPRQRLCKVFTDLPLEPDQPIDFGAQGFCEKCNICAHSCPAKAIRSGERTAEPTSISNRSGLLRWPVNVTECYLFWQRNGTSCSTCVAVCPWALHVPRDWV